MHISIVTPIWAQVPKEIAKQLQAACSYEADYYISGPYKKIKKTAEKSFIEARTGKVYSGLVPRIAAYCKERDIEITFDTFPKMAHGGIQPIEGIQLRDDQTSLLESALEHQRGILQAPTGSGKTVLAAHIIKAFPDKTVLFLVNAKGLLTQTRREFVENFGIENVGLLGDGVKEPDQITIATIQTLHRMGPNEFLNSIDIVIVDEAHHGQSKSFEDVLKHCPATIRFGLTATPPTDKAGLLKVEALLGPVIHQTTVDELRDVGILAKPTIKILKPPFNPSVEELKKYPEVYDKGIVNNRQRNKMILDEGAAVVARGEVVLVLVVKIEHGDNLVRMASILYPDLDITFVRGSTDTAARESLKDAMEIGHKRFVIATAVFREGISIKNVHMVINACGGKSELQLIQGIGRGLRTTDTKSEVTIIDFCDASHKYLQAHSLDRLWVYIDQGWLK